MSNVTKLPTAATSYLTVNKSGRFWNVVLVTPCPGRPLKTVLYSISDREHAIEQGQRTAAKMQRPFKGKGGAK
jgi:hypothetical protein